MTNDPMMNYRNFQTPESIMDSRITDTEKPMGSGAMSSAFVGPAKEGRGGGRAHIDRDEELESEVFGTESWGRHEGVREARDDYNKLQSVLGAGKRGRKYDLL